MIDGKMVFSHLEADGQVPQWATVDPSAGQTVSVLAEYLPRTGDQVRFGLGIAYEPEMIPAEAKTIAAAADVVIRVGGSSESTLLHADWTIN
jgi:hypothetical protein